MYSGILLSHKKEWNNNICSNMDRPRGYHINTKWRKSEREKQIPKDITYMWTLNYDTHKLIYKIKTDKGSWLAVAGGREGWLGNLVQTNIYRMDKQGPTVEHRELHSISCNKP